MPSCSSASSLPVRPSPVWISSRIRITLWRCRARARLEITRRRDDDAGLALDRLDQEGDGVGRDGALQRLGVAEGHDLEARREGPEARAARSDRSRSRRSPACGRGNCSSQTMISALPSGTPLTS